MRCTVLSVLLVAAARADVINVSSIDGAVTVHLADGRVAGVSVAGSPPAPLLGPSGTTQLTGGNLTAFSPSRCQPAASAVLARADGGGAALSRQWSCLVLDGSPGNGSAVQVVVVDSFVPETNSVRIQTSITAPDSSAPPFSSALQTGLHWAGSPGHQVWMPWGKGCTINAGSRSPCRGIPDWQDPLHPEPLPSSSQLYRYGALGRNAVDVFSIPVVSVLNLGEDIGVSLALSVEDPLLEVALETSESGVSFRRELLRLADGRTVEFSAHLVGHRADFRPALGFMVRQFPEYFISEVEGLEGFEGLGAYTWNMSKLNSSKAKAMGFKTNWDLSGTFMPYDGLFLPYSDQWENLGPINSGLAKYNVTYAMIDQYYADLQAKGFHSLSYFDIGNWGLSVTTTYRGPNTTCGRRPNGQPAPCPDWAGAQEYLRDYLFSGLLHHGWDIGAGRFMVHHNDWVGTTWMDTMEPCFEDLLVEQLERHIIQFPNTFEGIAIDRLDYSEAYNYDRDDNTSWVPLAPGVGADPRGAWPNTANWTWGPARSNRLSYRHTYARLHEVLKKARQGRGGPMMNNCNALGNVCRLDLLKNFDGTFSEGSALNPAAFTGLRTPTIQWTYSLSDDPLLIYAYFQQHLLMGAYPMAPIPLNDHSIQPGSAVVEAAYIKYGPLFDAMHGTKWLLSTRPVSVKSGSGDQPSINAFTVGSQTEGPNTALPMLVVPVVLANSTTTTSATVELNLGPTVAELGWPTVQRISAKALLPGSDGWFALPAATKVGSSWEIKVPLADGCAVVHIQLD